LTPVLTKQHWISKGTSEQALAQQKLDNANLERSKDLLAKTGEERRKFDAARARRLEEMEREEQIDLAIARLSRMGLPIASVEQGIVTIDFNLARLAER
jgi:uncharacterized protein with von Willebrand factor type A (vWA) domain